MSAILLLQTLPRDLLAQVARLLDFEDLTRLRLTTPALKRRLEQEESVKEVTIRTFRADTSALLPVSQWLTSLTISLSHHGKDQQREFKSSIEWLSCLPSTLVTIDFDFPTCISIWLSENPSNKCTWPFTTPTGHLAPIYMCDRFPQLRHLRLEGDWTQRITWRPTALDGHTGSLEEPKTLEIWWTRPMMALFLKKLPILLDTLEIPLPYAQLAFYWPPNLSKASLTYYGLIHQRNLYEPMPPIPDSLLQSIHSLKLTFCEDFIAQFRQLRTLHTSSGLSLETLSSLGSLTDLSFSAPAANWVYFARLPHSITKLQINRCGKSTLQGLQDPDQNPWSLLPPRVTSLHLDLDATIKDISSFYLLRNSLMHLTELSITTNGEYERLPLADLMWVPCDRLRTLSLAASSFSFELIWPDNIPNNITHLTLNRAIYTSSRSVQELAKSLPPNLTTLHYWPSRELDESFLQHCPPSLTLLDLMINARVPGINIALPLWNAGKMLSSGSSSRHRHLQVKVPITIEASDLPEGMTHLCPSSVLEWMRSVEILRFSIWVGDPRLKGTSSHYLRFFDNPLPQTITCIDWPPLTASDTSPVWKLPNLITLHADFISLPTVTSVRLTTLRIRHPFTSSFDCDSLRSLTNLSAFFIFHDEAEENVIFRSSIASLTNLQRLEILGISMSSCLQAVRDLFASIPRSVQHVEADGFPLFSNLNSLDRLNIPSIYQLKRVDLSKANWPMTDHDLKLLPPNVEEIELGVVTITNSVTFYAGIARDTKSLDDLSMVQSMCPSVTKLNIRTSKKIRWKFLQDPDLDSKFKTEIAKLIQASQKTLVDFKPLPALPRSNSLAGLPPSLTRLSMSYWISGMSSYLPETLLSLFIDSNALLHPYDILHGLPQSLTSLSLPLPLVSPAFISGMPRSLKSLRATSKQCILIPKWVDNIPPELETLVLSGAEIVRPTDVHGLPKTLKTLIVKSINTMTLKYLPFSLTRLEGVPVELRTANFASNGERIMGLRMPALVDLNLEKDKYDFWAHQPMSLWSSKLDLM